MCARLCGIAAAVKDSVDAYLVALDEAYRTGATTEVNSLVDTRCDLCVDVVAASTTCTARVGRIENCEAAPSHDVSREPDGTIRNWELQMAAHTA